MSLSRVISAYLLVVGAFVASACGTTEESTSDTSASSSDTPALTELPTASPTPSPLPRLVGTKVVFLHSPANGGYGSLGLANLDGSDRTEVAPGEVASFIGVRRERNSGEYILYYIARLEQHQYQLRSRNLSSGERADLLPLNWDRDYYGPSGSLRPDGLNLAVDHADGIEIIDLVTLESHRLLSNDRNGCPGPALLDWSRCFGYVRPQWSPDGQLLLVSHNYHEVSTLEIISPESGALIAKLSTGNGAWSPGANAVCQTESVGLHQGAFYLSAGPEWASNVVVEPGNESFESCVWLDDGTVAFVRIIGDNLSSWQVSLLDTSTSNVSVLLSGETPPHPYDLVRVGASQFIFNTPDTLNPVSQIFGQPQLVTAGVAVAVMPVLEAGDAVVAVVQSP